MKNVKRLVILGLAAAALVSLPGCGKKEISPTANENAALPTMDALNLGADYKDLEASIKILTDRTDVVDTTYKGYAEQFMKLYPGIQVTYEAITNYSESLNLRLTTRDWGDICYIPTSVNKDELAEHFAPLGSYETLNEIYNFCAEKSYGGIQYGIPNGGTAGGIVYNKTVWEAAGITQIPATPDEFLDCLQLIKERTGAVPLYTNFSAGWTMGAWDQYIGGTATGDPDFMSYTIVHSKDPFAKRDDMSGPYAVYYVLYEAVRRGLVEDDPASSDWESSKGMINDGRIASMVLGSWAVEQCKMAGANPEDVSYMPFPISVKGQRYASAIGNYAYAINKHSSEENQIAAMLYVKWMLEESPVFSDEGSIPALKSAPYPDVLKDFGDVELITDNAAPEGEETLFQDVNNEGEVGINNNDYPDCEILEAALYGTKTLDELMEEWNAKWSRAQEKLGVEVWE